MFPSQKAQQRERQKLHGMTGAKRRWKSVPKLIAELNRQLRGWANYFAFGYPTPAFRAMDWYVLQRLRQNLRRRSRGPINYRRVSIVTPSSGSTGYSSSGLSLLSGSL